MTQREVLAKHGFQELLPLVGKTVVLFRGSDASVISKKGDGWVGRSIRRGETALFECPIDALHALEGPKPRKRNSKR